MEFDIGDLDSVYSRAQLDVEAYLSLSESEVEDSDFSYISEMLDSELVSSINDLDIEGDADTAEEALRKTVHQLQLTAFTAGAYYQQLQEGENEIVEEEGDVVLFVDAEKKLEIAKSLLNGSGINFKLK